ncbi:MAG TPA: hypothetical protein VHY08_16325 [Bacillota bacterium]|nr:hypothetical protein [Bacillota bacterium]
MTLKSISNPDLLRVFDEDTYEIYHGCNQKWYTTVWRRLSGCGPTVASNLIFYLEQTHSISGLRQNSITKKNCLKIMEVIWKYVTPTITGVSSTKIFYQGVLSFAKSKGLDLEYQCLDLPKDKSCRPRLSEVLVFLEKGLLKDAPIAFLNLCNGAEKSLEYWHWVTIISLEEIENGTQIFINILDDGQLKKIDLVLWYTSTTKGGGFVYFTPSPEPLTDIGHRHIL